MSVILRITLFGIEDDLDFVMYCIFYKTFCLIKKVLCFGNR